MASAPVSSGGGAPRALVLLPGAATRFSAAVHAVLPGQWNDPTPCTEWSVADLVNHVVSEHLWAPHLLRGETIEAVGDRYDGDVVGVDPAVACDRAVKPSIEAFGAVDTAAEVHLSFGTVPVEEYANQMLVDLVVHGWDLARAIGSDDRMERDTVEVCLTYMRARVAEYSGAGVIGPSVVTGSSDPQDQLIALLGRDPGWTSPG